MADSFKIKRSDIFLGKQLKHGESGGISFVRLAKKNAGQWKRPVHEVWDIPTKSDQLINPINHLAADTITDFVKKINRYTTINSHYLFDKKVHVSFIDIILYPGGKFIRNYIIKKGFLDGTHGFIHAVFMSFHSFLTRAKLYLLWYYKPIK